MFTLLAEQHDTTGSDRIRKIAEHAYQQFVDAEAAVAIGADPYERTTDRLTHRNGARPKILATTAGDLQVRLPKLCTGPFRLSLLEGRRRIDRVLFAVAAEVYAHGCPQEGLMTSSPPWVWRPESASPGSRHLR